MQHITDLHRDVSKQALYKAVGNKKKYLATIDKWEKQLFDCVNGERQRYDWGLKYKLEFIKPLFKIDVENPRKETDYEQYCDEIKRKILLIEMLRNNNQWITWKMYKETIHNVSQWILKQQSPPENYGSKLLNKIGVLDKEVTKLKDMLQTKMDTLFFISDSLNEIKRIQTHFINESIDYKEGCCILEEELNKVLTAGNQISNQTVVKYVEIINGILNGKNVVKRNPFLALNSEIEKTLQLSNKIVKVLQQLGIYDFNELFLKCIDDYEHLNSFVKLTSEDYSHVGTLYEELKKNVFKLYEGVRLKMKEFEMDSKLSFDEIYTESLKPFGLIKPFFHNIKKKSFAWKDY